MASWIEPELDWNADDSPVPSDFIRVEGDIEYLKDAIDAEIGNRGEAVSQEATARINGDTALDTAIDTEVALNAGYHNGTTAGELRLAPINISSLPAASAAMYGRIMLVYKIVSSSSPYVVATRLYACMMSASGTTTYEWVVVAECGLWA